MYVCMLCVIVCSVLVCVCVYGWMCWFGYGCVYACECMCVGIRIWIGFIAWNCMFVGLVAAM